MGKIFNDQKHHMDKLGLPMIDDEIVELCRQHA